MHVIIHYYIKPVCSRQKFASNAGKSHQPRHLEDKTPEVINSIDQKKAFTHLWNRFCAWFPLSVLFCCATEEMYNVFFSTRAPPTDFKDLGVPRKVPLGEDRLGSVPTHWSAEVLNENSFQLCPYNNPRLLMTFLQSTILARDSRTSQSWRGGGLRSWL